MLTCRRALQVYTACAVTPSLSYNPTVFTVYFTCIPMYADSMTFPSPPRSPSPLVRGPSESSAHTYLRPHEYHLTNQSTPDLSRAASPTETIVELPAAAATLGEIPTSNYLNAAAYSTPASAQNENGPQRKANRIARRVHGWTWQAFPVGMGTGAVYVSKD